MPGRSAVLVAASFVAASFVAAAGVALAVGAAAAPHLPRVSACGDAFVVRPDYVLLGCGDGGQYLADVRWTTWSPTEARGTAAWWQNLCRPDCAAGHFRIDHVTVTLWRPRSCRSPRVALFTRMKLAGGSSRPTVTKVPYGGTTRCP